MMNIPLVDLKKQYIAIKQDIDCAITRVCERADFILGDEVARFEDQFAKYIGVKYCIGVASGTDALKLMGMALPILPGDEVIVQANTFIASVLPYIELGATIKFVDCDPNGQIDIHAVKNAVSKRTRAIVAVHLYGTPAPLAALSKLLNSNALRSNTTPYPLPTILEDAAQAHGSSIDGKKCGSFGEMAAFSFYPGKNLGAYGDGGAVVTNNSRLAAKLRILRNIGQKEKYNHTMLGINSRLDTIQAAVLSVKLKHLDEWNRKRNSIALSYLNNLSHLRNVVLPSTINNQQSPITNHSNHHLFVIQTKKRNALAAFLHSKGIHTGIHYPVPLHLTGALKYLGYKKGDFPNAQYRAKTILTIPLYAQLTEKETNYIIKNITAFF